MCSVSWKSMFLSRLLSLLTLLAISLLIMSSLSLLEFRHSPNSDVQLITAQNGDASSVSSRPIRERTSLQESSSSQDPNTRDCHRALIRIYMYDLPPQFHFGLLDWKPNADQTWPNTTDRSKLWSYPGGLNLQHSAEYWLTLDLLASSSNTKRPCAAIRVRNSSEADFIFIPFFSSLSYNRHSKISERERVSVDRLLQETLVKFLQKRKEWKTSGGKDHIIVAHHPNSMLFARKKLGSAVFILADFGRYESGTANIHKDVIAPYKHMVTTVSPDKSATFVRRPTLVYFQGAIFRKEGGMIRQELYNLLKDEKDVHFTFGSVGSNGIREAGKGMSSSKFCLNIAGDTPSSNRLFDAIASLCVPVIISDEIELPFEDVLDYSEFCVFVRSKDAVKKGFLLNLLRGIREERWTQMWVRLKEISKHFEYQYPSETGDAVDMIWQTIYRKKMNTELDLQLHRKSRYQLPRHI